MLILCEQYRCNAVSLFVSELPKFSPLLHHALSGSSIFKKKNPAAAEKKQFLRKQTQTFVNTYHLLK